MSSDKVTADSYGTVLNTSEAGDECWMLRVPPNLAKAWEEMPEGAVLGELVFRKGGGKDSSGKPIKPGLDIHVDPNVDQPKEHQHNQAPLPLQYSLQAMTKKLPTLHPFSRKPNGSIHLHGTVTRTGNLQVHQDANYRQLLKNRILQSTVHNSRYVKPVDANQVVQQTSKKRSNNTAGATAAASQGFGEAIHQYGKRLLEQQQQGPSNSNKKTKFSPEQTTKSVLFQLFSQQQYWTVKDLKMASGGRPDTEIRDVLREIGEYHRAGDHKNSWELRKEFQNTKSESTDNTKSES